MDNKERRELVEYLNRTRPSGNQPFKAPYSYEKYFADTNVEEKIIQTSAGDTKIWVVDKIGRETESAVFVNIHGGGFVAPHMERDIVFSRRIASEVGVLVVDISYRTVEEEGFPVACFESYDCVKWVHDHAAELGINAEKIMVGGHSAGGNLTVAICLLAKKRKEFHVALQILDYPPLDLYTDPEDKPESDKTLIPPQRARDFNRLYVGNEENAKNVLASPVFADVEMLKGLPETLIITAGQDNLRFEAEKFAVQLIEAGVPVSVCRYVSSGHGFVIACTGEYEQAIQRMEEVMRTVITRPNNRWNDPDTEMLNINTNME